MISLLLSFVFSFFALFVSLWLMPGFQLENISNFALSVLILGFMNFVLAPMLLMMKLNIKISSLGIFSFIMNFLILNIATGLIDEFSWKSIECAIFGAGLLAFLQVGMDSIDSDRSALTRP